jgi:hypothetical protein
MPSNTFNRIAAGVTATYLRDISRVAPPAQDADARRATTTGLRHDAVRADHAGSAHRAAARHRSSRRRGAAGAGLRPPRAAVALAGIDAALADRALHVLPRRDARELRER